MCATPSAPRTMSRCARSLLPNSVRCGRHCATQYVGHCFCLSRMQHILALHAYQGMQLPPQVPDVEKFMAEYNMQCPMAAKRLIYSGMPATVEHGKPRCAS